MYTMEHVPGKFLYTADALSRSLAPLDDNGLVIYPLGMWIVL